MKLISFKSFAFCATIFLCSIGFLWAQPKPVVYILATGGTALAAIKLINRFNPQSISTLFFMELED